MASVTTAAEKTPAMRGEHTLRNLLLILMIPLVLAILIFVAINRWYDPHKAEVIALTFAIFSSVLLVVQYMWHRKHVQKNNSTVGPYLGILINMLNCAFGWTVYALLRKRKFIKARKMSIALLVTVCFAVGLVLIFFVIARACNASCPACPAGLCQALNIAHGPGTIFSITVDPRLQPAAASAAAAAAASAAAATTVPGISNSMVEMMKTMGIDWPGMGKETRPAAATSSSAAANATTGSSTAANATTASIQPTDLMPKSDCVLKRADIATCPRTPPGKFEDWIKDLIG